MCEIVKEFGVLQFIEAFGFCRFLFQNNGYDLEKGLVLVTDDDCHAQRVIDAILTTVDSREMRHLSSKVEKPFNYEIGLHLYRKYDKEQEILEFLVEKRFTPLVIVGGILPEFLEENSYMFRFDLRGSDIRDFADMYKKMKNEVLSHLEHLMYEISNFKSSKLLKQIEIDESSQGCFEIFALTGKVWQLVLRESNDEETAERWLNSYCEASATTLRKMDDLCGLCDISEVIRKCVVTYVMKNDVKMMEFHTITGDSDSIETIWYDADYYYFSESFLKKICKPLQNTVSFQQIKTELCEAGILVCNNTKNRNFTVKKSCFDIQTGCERRIRFLKLVKQELFSDEGMELEELVEIKRVNNKTEKEGFEYGNDHRICEGEYQSEDF